jgi:hypothetical protein
MLHAASVPRVTPSESCADPGLAIAGPELERGARCRAAGWLRDARVDPVGFLPKPCIFTDMEHAIDIGIGTSR